MPVETEYKIIISKRAEKRLENIVEYLLEEWNDKVKSDFIGKFNRMISFLSANPYMFPYFIDEKEIRKCLITKHNAMYYQVNNNVVKIITIHDTRQNPKTLKL
ncbi:MAG: type II toxin-antitoxin system RelE/ParE family toxin [Bacteroidota bacterium]|nr:type II toxin-antitoxin system RelE/ParE family toxin [Bacteroidota bacterium]